MKRLLQWLSYMFSGSCLLLGTIMFLSRKFALSIGLLGLAVLIFFPIGYIFQIQANHRAALLEVEEEIEARAAASSD